VFKEFKSKTDLELGHVFYGKWKDPTWGERVEDPYIKENFSENKNRAENL